MELVELHHELVFHDKHGMPNMWVCIEKEPDRIVLKRRMKCECGGTLGIETDGDGDYWEFCLKCNKKFRERPDTVFW